MAGHCIFLLFASFLFWRYKTMNRISRVKGYSIILTLLLLKRKATSASCFPCASFIVSVLKSAVLLSTIVFYLPTSFKHTGGPTFWWARKSRQRKKGLLQSILKNQTSTIYKTCSEWFQQLAHWENRKLSFLQFYPWHEQKMPVNCITSK